MSNITGDKITFYEVGQPGKSTINQEVQRAGNETLLKQEVMTSLNLAKLCHSYFLKRPKFMSIDIEGVNYLPLSTNDWANEKCVPELIYA